MFEWSHLTYGVLATCDTLEEIEDVMAEKEYPEPNVARMREALHLTDEFEYCMGLLKVKKIKL